MLSLSKDELRSNEQIQELLTQLGESQLKMNTQMESKKNSGRFLKVQNFQALINDSYNLKDSDTEKDQKDEEEANQNANTLRDVTEVFMHGKTPDQSKELPNSSSVCRFFEGQRETTDQGEKTWIMLPKPNSNYRFNFGNPNLRNDLSDFGQSRDFGSNY